MIVVSNKQTDQLVMGRYDLTKYSFSLSTQESQPARLAQALKQ
jgi:hypothetical protein